MGYLKRLILSLSSCYETLHREAFMLTKSHKHTYSPILTYSSKPFVLIHFHVWSLAPRFYIMISLILFLFWMIILVCIGFIFLNTNPMFLMSVKFHKMLFTQFQAKLQILRSDNGGEYINITNERIHVYS